MKEKLNRSNLNLQEAEAFNLVKDRPIILPRLYQTDKNNTWNPFFSPQVTIQHPLKVTIPLYFYLFSGTDYIERLAKAVPDLNNLQRNQEKSMGLELNNTLCKPLNSLVFLHALTLTGISGSNILKTDSDVLKSTLDDYNKYKQIDVKMNLMLMSRRSFSEMFKEIKVDPSLNFTQYYQDKLISGNQHFQNSQIHERIKESNYGEQYFDEEYEPKNLILIKSCFNGDFYQKNKQVIRKLLKNGIITTTMLRNFKEDYTIKDKKISEVFKEYFNLSIESVVSLPKLRYTIELNDTDSTSNNNQNTTLNIKSGDAISFIEAKDEHDSLSPPWFLGANDSMGKYSRGNTNHYPEYGEAIIEIRAIQDLSLSIMEAFEIKGFFNQPDNIQKHAGILCDIIANFQNNMANADHRAELLKNVVREASASIVN